MVTRSLKYNFSQSDDKSRRSRLALALVTIFFTVQLSPGPMAFAEAPSTQYSSSAEPSIHVVEGALERLNDEQFSRVDETFVTNGGQSGEMTIEAGGLRAFNTVVGDASAVIDPPSDREHPADAVIVESDLTPAATQAFLDAHPMLENAMVADGQHTVLVHDRIQWLPKQQLKEGIIYTLVRTGISTCVYMRLLNHSPTSDEKAIATTFALTLLFNSTNLYYFITHNGHKFWSKLGFHRLLESLGLKQITQDAQHYYESTCFATWLAYGFLSTALYKGLGISPGIVKPTLEGFFSSFPWSRSYYRWVHLESPPLKQQMWVQRAVWLRAALMAIVGPMILVGHNSGEVRGFVDGLTITGVAVYLGTYKPVRVRIGQGVRSFMSQMRRRFYKIADGAFGTLTSSRAKQCWKILVAGRTRHQYGRGRKLW